MWNLQNFVRIKLFEELKKKKKENSRKKKISNSWTIIVIIQYYIKKLAFTVTISNITNYAVVFTFLICDVLLITVSNKTKYFKP